MSIQPEGEEIRKATKWISEKLKYEKDMSLAGAIEQAYQLARTGDNILLSPACSSFDMFTDYEDRGRKFKKAVMELKYKYEN